MASTSTAIAPGLPRLTLVSHHLCPYVQRAAIALAEKGVAFDRRYIDLADKPDWFRQLSPLGKVPLLLIDDREVLFESAVIAQYVNEVTGGGLLAASPLERARQLAWMEFISQLIADIGRFYSAADGAAFQAAAAALRSKFCHLEDKLGDGPWFGGETFTLVDAAAAPAFRYFDVFDELVDVGLLDRTPKVARWRAALAERPSVVSAVTPDYPERLLEFVRKRDSVLGGLARATREGESSCN